MIFFGSFLIATIGYGFTILLMLMAVASLALCFEKRGNPSECSGFFKALIIFICVALISAAITRELLS